MYHLIIEHSFVFMNNPVLIIESSSSQARKCSRVALLIYGSTCFMSIENSFSLICFVVFHSIVKKKIVYHFGFFWVPNSTYFWLSVKWVCCKFSNKSLYEKRDYFQNNCPNDIKPVFCFQKLFSETVCQTHF